jgi:4-carboxymuconolactone decarboxylase
MSEHERTEGERQARRYFGAERYEATRVNSPTGFQRDLLGFADEVVFGTVYAREGLDLRTRALCTVAALTVLGREPQLRAHLVGALNIGVSAEELAEVIRQMAMYGGFPSALNAARILDELVNQESS